MRSQIFSILALTASLTSAHFILHWPPSAGFDEDKEPISPCGGFTPSASSSTNITIDRFQVLIENVHPVGQWSFRGTTSTSAPYNFTEIVPIVNTTGVSEFCLEYLSAPEEWAGKEGVLQVVDNSPDGILFQCAAVTWVSGSNDTVGASCSNSSSAFTATWTNQQSFPGEPAGGEGSGHGNGAHASSGGTSSTSTGAAAVATGVGSLVVGGLGLVIAGLAL